MAKRGRDDPDASAAGITLPANVDETDRPILLLQVARVVAGARPSGRGHEQTARSHGVPAASFEARPGISVQRFNQEADATRADHYEVTIDLPIQCELDSGALNQVRMLAPARTTQPSTFRSWTTQGVQRENVQWTYVSARRPEPPFRETEAHVTFTYKTIEPPSGSVDWWTTTM